MEGACQAVVVMTPAQMRPQIPMRVTGSGRKRGERRERRRRRNRPTYVSWILSCRPLSATDFDNRKKANSKMKSPRMWSNSMNAGNAASLMDPLDHRGTQALSSSPWTFQGMGAGTSMYLVWCILMIDSVFPAQTWWLYCNCRKAS